MTTRQIAAPAALAVSIEEARETLRLDDESLDATMTLHIKGITREAEHVTGRAFVNRPCRVTLDSFQDAIRLDHPPIASVESVRYMDDAGAWQTLDPADYRVDSVSAPGYVMPARGKAWPSTADEVNAVEVNYTAGYGPDHATVPEEAQNYILAKLQVQFEPASGGSGSVGKPFNVGYMDGLLDSLKVY